MMAAEEGGGGGADVAAGDDASGGVAKGGRCRAIQSRKTMQSFLKMGSA